MKRALLAVDGDGSSEYTCTCVCMYIYIYGSFPKLVVSFLGVPMKRIRVLGGLYWVPLFWETTICIHM